jgi:hypothetical protein
MGHDMPVELKIQVPHMVQPNTRALTSRSTGRNTASAQRAGTNRQIDRNTVRQAAKIR